MELFSELYGRYYAVMDDVLAAASQRTIPAKEINDIISTQGFAESLLGLAPKLLEGGEESYNLLLHQGNSYTSVLKSKPSKVYTLTQKMWLKALLSDPRIRLFLSKPDISELDAALFDVQPLYSDSFIKSVDLSSDGDNFENVDYISNFKTILSALQEKKCLKIRYHNAEGKRIQGDFAPYRLEYSLKDDKFRLSCIKLKGGKLKKKHFLVRIFLQLSFLSHHPQSDVILNNINKYPR